MEGKKKIEISFKEIPPKNTKASIDPTPIIKERKSPKMINGK